MSLRRMRCILCIFGAFFLSPVLTFAQQSGQNDLIIDDKFFDLEFYDQVWRMRDDKQQEIAETVLQKFKKAALNEPDVKGLSDVTRAIFEGDFNPYFKDVEMALEGLAGVKDLTRDDIPQDKRASLIDQRIMEESDDVPPRLADRRIYLNGVLKGKRNRLWNETFGSLLDLKDTKLNTIVNGKNVTLTGNDLAVRQRIRLSGRRFESDYESILKIDPNLRYDDAITRLQSAGKSHLVEKFKTDIEKIMLYQSGAVSHFRLSSRHADSEFNLLKDYETLREVRYLSKVVGRITAKEEEQKQVD